MASSKAKTVEAYLRSLPDAIREEIGTVRELVLTHLQPGFVETMNWGMISYEVPLATYSQTYNKKPLMFAALAAQKSHNSLYLMCNYNEPSIEQRIITGFAAIGETPNMGKSCIRYRSATRLPLKVIGEIISEITLERFIQHYESCKVS